jgi:hypothetical protein
MPVPYFIIEMDVLDAMTRGDPPFPGNKVELAPADHRRNPTTLGVPLNQLVGKRFNGRRRDGRWPPELSLQVSRETAGAAGLYAASQSLRAQLSDRARRNHPQGRTIAASARQIEAGSGCAAKKRELLQCVCGARPEARMVTTLRGQCSKIKQVVVP